MNLIFWITIIVCITAVTITSIICSTKIEVSKYEAFNEAFTHAVNNEATDNELKKMVDNLKVTLTEMKEK